MQLEIYISDLLYRYECVCVPEFGAFLTQKSSATFDENTTTFYPPKKVLSFNEQIQNNDGLLANYIADIEKISFETANEKIANDVKLLKSYLIQGETIELKNIGLLVFNSEGKIVFEPFHHLNYLTDAFGLYQFKAFSINREAYKEQVAHTEKVIPIGLPLQPRTYKSFLKYVAVLIIALAIASIGLFGFYLNQVKTHNELAQKEAQKQLNNKIQEATFSLNSLPPITLSVVKKSYDYHIIAGAFRVEANAINIVSQLKSLGYLAKIIGINKFGLHEVAYASYDNRDHAIQDLKFIKKTLNGDAWLLFKPLD